MNKVFQGLSLEFVRQGISLSTFEKFFSDKTGESSRFPTDEQFKAGILSQPVYQLAPGNRVKDILWELEEIARSNFAEKSLMPEKLQTEHVLPISWNEDWPFIDGEWEHRHSGYPKAVRRNQVLHTLGNLTLITGGLNSSSSNRSFAEKKEKFEEHTALFLNKWFSKHSKWNEEKIQERGRYFAELAPKIWIGPN